MRQTFEATIDERGNVKLLESIHVPNKCRALVIVLDPLLQPSIIVQQNESELGHTRIVPEKF